MTESVKTMWSAMEPKKRKLVKMTAGVVLGSIAGYTYYALVGCSTGSCPITSNPWISTFWGALIGVTASA